MTSKEKNMYKENGSKLCLDCTENWPLLPLFPPHTHTHTPSFVRDVVFRFSIKLDQDLLFLN